MPGKKFLIPQKGLDVPYEDGRKLLPPTGAEVTISPYWRRRIKEGAVAEGTSPKASTTKAKE